jgi:hypothetical protein
MKKKKRRRRKTDPKINDMRRFGGVLSTLRKKIPKES